MEIASPDAAAGRIGRYQLVAQIGSGPLGPLWVACIAAGNEEGRLVAVRRLPVSSADQQHQQSVNRAGIAAMSIRHARLTAMLDVMPSPKDVAVVSEYVEAASLRSVLRNATIKRTPLPTSVCVAIAQDVILALRAGRDLWSEVSPGPGTPLGRACFGGLLPDSVMIASFGETMLADLGVAGAALAAPSLAKHPEAVAYRAPEQLEGRVDERSDVFSVGVLLWEMLANRAPESAPLPRLDGLERAGTPVPRMLVEIVQEALAPDPGRRFPTLDALLDAIRTLTRDSIASPAQVAVAVDRLVRTELDKRRAAIDLVAGYDRASAPPESARPTARPPPPEAPILVRTPSGFPAQEAPTARRRQTPRPDKLSVPRLTAPPLALGKIARGEASVSVPPSAPAPAPPAETVDVQEPSGITVAPTAQTGVPAATAGLRPGRRTAVVIIAVAAAVALLVIAMVRALEPAPDASPAMASEAPAPAEPTPEAASAPVAASAEPTSEPSPPAAADEEPQRALPPSRAPSPPPPTGKKPFRPRGI